MYACFWLFSFLFFGLFWPGVAGLGLAASYTEQRADRATRRGERGARAWGTSEWGRVSERVRDNLLQQQQEIAPCIFDLDVDQHGYGWTDLGAKLSCRTGHLRSSPNDLLAVLQSRVGRARVCWADRTGAGPDRGGAGRRADAIL